MSTAYSFLDVTAAFSGPTASFSLKGGNAEEGITITMRADKNDLVIGADGKGMHSLRADNSAAVTIRLLKNSSINSQLIGAYNSQKGSAVNWGQNVINITSSIGDTVALTGVAFKKVPALTYAEKGGINEWEFEAIEAITNLATTSIN